MDIPLFETWTQLYDINVNLLNTWTHLDSNVEESDRVEIERFQQQDKLNYQYRPKKLSYSQLLSGKGLVRPEAKHYEIEKQFCQHG